MDKLISDREQQTERAYGAALEGHDDLEARVSELAAIRSREGYMAEWERLDDGTYLLAENHCPICAAATECQGLCRAELLVFQSVLGPEVHVERAEHILAGARRCAYRISPKGGPNGSS